MPSTDPVRTAERILAGALGSSVRLTAGKLAGVGNKGFLVSRHEVEAGPAEAPARVVVKRVNPQAGEPYSPEKPGGPAGSLLDEWASLELLTELCGPDSPAPRLYGGDRGLGLLVMEDLGRGPSLVEALFAADPDAAEEALLEYFTVLGRTNASTLGQRQRFERLRRDLGPVAPQSSVAELRGVLASALSGACHLVGLPHPRHALPEIEIVAGTAAEPGPFAALSQLDTCPDNCLRADGRIRLIDFGGGGFFHALNDGGRARANFPTCWSVFALPDSVIERAEQCYRAELARRCPEARDDRRFGEELAAVCAFWTIHNLGIFLPRVVAQDERRACASEREKLLERLRLLSDTCQTFGTLPALGDVALELLGRLRARWPEAAAIPLYPAFRETRR
jgi:hypothetical protein